MAAQPLPPLSRPRPLRSARPLALSVAWLLSLGLHGPAAQAQLRVHTPAAAASKASQPEPPVTIEADRLTGRAGQDAVAEGDVRLRREDVQLDADRVSYQAGTRTAEAQGHVRLDSKESTVSGPGLRLNLDSFAGEFKEPKYRFKRNGAEGQAARFEFIDRQRGAAVDATYSSCRRQDYPEGDPLPWELKARRVQLDFERNVGVADGAVLRFYGVPILAAPVLSFPLSDDRKTGWLPPVTGFDTRGGYSLAVPWYWNIAPNLDATLIPMLATKRGVGVAAEGRYLFPGQSGTLNLHEQWHDPIVGRERWSTLWQHEGHPSADSEFGLRWQRASDDEYWKDFNHQLSNVTPRLLPSRGWAASHWDADWGRTTAYLGSQRFQVLQDASAPIVEPYNRDLQGGLRGFGHGAGLNWSWETEADRFSHRDSSFIRGDRVHALGRIERPFGDEGYTFTPRLGLSAVAWDTDRPMADGRTRAHRILPTLSLDNAWVLERDTTLFGSAVTQTLEPRLLYVKTPYRAQSNLPRFETASNDFNADSVFSENAFSGLDRVSDANQITGGFTTRFIDRASGGESLRLGLAQRVLLDDQQVTANDGPPLTQRWSDLLLFGSTSIVPHWAFDALAQYSPEISRTTRSVFSARYSPGPYRTLGATYRYTRGSAQQIDLGWQWPIWGPAAGRGSSGGSCSGSLYSVGRTNYSLRETRLTDALIGFEYDAGCWVGRIYASRLSTGLSQGVTSFGLELEFVGLSRLPIGSASKTLRDNIPGYQPLRGDSPRTVTTP